MVRLTVSTLKDGLGLRSYGDSDLIFLLLIRAADIFNLYLIAEASCCLFAYISWRLGSFLLESLWKSSLRR